MSFILDGWKYTIIESFNILFDSAIFTILHQKSPGRNILD